MNIVRFGVVLLSAISLAGCMQTGAEFAQALVPPQPVPSSWSKACPMIEGHVRCRLEYKATSSEGAWLVVYAAKLTPDMLSIGFVTSPEVQAAYGITVDDGQGPPTMVAVSQCLPSECRSVSSLGKADQQRLYASQALEITYAVAGRPQHFVVPTGNLLKNLEDLAKTQANANLAANNHPRR